MNLFFVGFRHSHIESLYNLAKQNDDVNIIGCYETDRETIESCEKRLQIKFTDLSLEEILEDKKIDAIAIGDYYGNRGNLIIKALTANKHVICDKPICISERELNQIDKLLKSHNLVLSCMLDLRYLQITQKAKEIIESGKVGKVTNVDFTGQHCLNYGIRPGWYFEKGKHGGTINDIAIHGIDLTQYVSGSHFNKIYSSRVWNAYAKQVPYFKDSGMFMASLDNGAGVVADVSYAAPRGNWMKLPTYWDFSIWCEKALIKLNVASDTLTLFEEGFENGKVLVENKGFAVDTLTDFVNRVSGKTGLLTNEEVIDSTRFALRLQKLGDRK